jgi:hypothetical protein
MIDTLQIDRFSKAKILNKRERFETACKKFEDR